MRFLGASPGSAISRPELTKEITLEQKHIAPPPVEKPTFRVEIETEPRAATIELDGQRAGTGALDQRLSSDGVEHVIVARAPGYRDMTVRFTDRPPPHLLALEPATVGNGPSNPSGGDTAPRAVENDEAPRQRPRPKAESAPASGGRHHHGKPHPAEHSGPSKPASNGATHSDPGVSSNGAPIID
jgi:hypothetical protein